MLHIFSKGLGVRPGLARLIPTSHYLVTARSKRYEAFDASLDQDALAEARSWFQSFDAASLPKGNTTYARSSGPGGQHVNKYGYENNNSPIHNTSCVRELMERLTKMTLKNRIQGHLDIPSPGALICSAQDATCRYSGI